MNYYPTATTSASELDSTQYTQYYYPNHHHPQALHHLQQQQQQEQQQHQYYHAQQQQQQQQQLYHQQQQQQQQYQMMMMTNNSSSQQRRRTNSNSNHGALRAQKPQPMIDVEAIERDAMINHHIEPPIGDATLGLMLLEEMEEQKRRMELKDVEDPDRLDITISETLNDALDQSREAVESVVYSIYVLAKDQHRNVGGKSEEFQSDNLV